MYTNAINKWNYDGKREKGNTIPTKSSQKTYLWKKTHERLMWKKEKKVLFYLFKSITKK